MVPITKDRISNQRRPIIVAAASWTIACCNAAAIKIIGSGGGGTTYRKRGRERRLILHYLFMLVAGVTPLLFLMYFHLFATSTKASSSIMSQIMMGQQPTRGDPFMDAFWESKRIATSTYISIPSPQLPNTFGNATNDPKLSDYLTCIAKVDPKYFKSLSGPVVKLYNQMTAKQQRQMAEKFWYKRQGKIWMQHSRKAGGTSLCMILHLNHQQHLNNNNKPNSAAAAPPALLLKQETCQLPDFCNDCDLTIRSGLYSAGEFRGWKTVPRLIDCITNAQKNNQRNYIEMEGTVSPPDILTNPEWSNFVFISSLRHPIARIISSLRNDPPYYNQLSSSSAKKDGLGMMESSSTTTVVDDDGGCYEKKPTNPRQLTGCAHKAIAVASKMLDKCRRGIYYCYSNYYVRIFAGYHPDSIDVDGGSGGTNPFGQLPNTFHTLKKGGQQQQQDEITRQTLEQAKRNFLRYSCVILQEDWDRTSTCIHSKLGMPTRLLQSESIRYNVDGNLSVNHHHHHHDGSNGNNNNNNEESAAESSLRRKAAAAATTTTIIQYSNDTFLESLDGPQEYERILQLNALDLEFYEWAKKLILDGYFAN